jgi:CheY-like chemotaxis protein
MPNASCNVLVVDDDAEIRETLVELLEERGYRTVAASNGKQALDALQRGERPELILLDMMMPVMDGAQFRAKQREDSELAGIPVVLISAHEDLSKRVRELGARSALQKPISFRDLIDTVRRFCGRRGAPTPVPI